MTDSLTKIALKLASDGPYQTLPTPRLVQLLLNGVFIVQTTKAIMVWEHRYYPVYYIPRGEIREGDGDGGLRVEKGEEIKREEDGKVVARKLVLRVGGRKVEGVVEFDGGLKGEAEVLGGLVRVEFGEIDQWFEEATPISSHPKDPFKRIDILHSTRRVVVKVGGVQVAETNSSMHLYETGLPARYYLPRTSIDPKVLQHSKKGTKTKCPYKGEADYFDVVLQDGRVFEDVVWYYDHPILESAKIEGLCCFYNEKVQIELEGEVLETPVTHFSNARPNQKPSVL